jgi:RNA polymerase sigma-70 factor (ECF subfamily)
MAIRVEEVDDRTGCVDIDRDRLLVVRHQDGDHAAFDELYRRYHGRLVGYCQRRVGDRHVAEELAQEAFVRALRAMPRFAGERRFYPWMTVIAQRLCIDHHRKASRVEPAAEVDAGTVEADHDELWAAVDRGHLGAAVERLAPRHREILELREQRGWSYQQIADHLDVPLTTVEALLHRARKALRREFLVVAGDDGAAFGVGGRLAGFAGLAAVLARAKDWLAALGPDRLIPAVGAAAAGVAAVGAVVAPAVNGNDAGPDQVAATETTTEVTSAPTSLPSDPVTVDGTAASVAPAAGGPTTTVAGATTATDDTLAPPPSVDLGVASLYPGEAGAAYTEQLIDEMPLQIDLRPLVLVGADPNSIIEPLLEALGTGTALSVPKLPVLTLPLG